MDDDIPALCVEEIDRLSYNELRRFAKLYKIKSNQKAVKLRTELKKAITNRSESCVPASPSDLDERSENNPSHDSPFVSKTVSEHRSSSTNSTSKSPVSFIDAGLISVTNSTCSDVSVQRASTQHHVQSKRSLNETYELEEPVFAIPASQVNTEESPKDHGLPLPSAVVPCVDSTFTTEQKVNTLPALKSTKARPILSRVRPVPDFKRIHAQVAAKMESLPEFLERRRQGLKPEGTRAPFASPRFRRTALEHKTQVQNSGGNRAPVPLSDLTNNHTKPGSTVRSSLTESRKHSGTHSSLQSKPSVTVKRSGTHIPADSAFARRKAYDFKRRLSATPSKNAVPPVSSPMATNNPFKTRIDPRVHSFETHVTVQKRKATNLIQFNRNVMKRCVFDSNRGLRC